MKFLIAAILIFSLVKANAQNVKTYKKDSSLIWNSPSVIIKLQPSFSVIKPLLPFGKFIIKDVRQDTTSIGVQMRTAAFFDKYFYHKLVFDKPASVVVADYLNGSGKCNENLTGTQLICFIKTLRIVQYDSIDKSSNTKELYNKVSFTTEAYLGKQEACYPALRIDTTVLTATTAKKEFEIVSDLLDAIAIKAASIDTMKVFSRKAYSVDAITDRYEQVWNKPVLTAKNFTPGVYKSFQELVNNDPSIKEYEFRKDRKVTTLYRKTLEGEWIIETKAFGFCDGKIIWMNVKNTFHPLIRIENTFEFMGDYVSSDYTPGSDAVPIQMAANPLINLGTSALFSSPGGVPFEAMQGKVIHQIDMETGKFY